MAYLDKKRQAEASRKHYLANKDKIKARAAKFRKFSIDRNRKFTFNYLLKHPCVDCHETNPVLLEFDHRNRKLKIDNIANLSRSGVSINSLEKEISKCDVRCVRCHRLKTAKELNWWIYRAAEELGSN